LDNLRQAVYSGCPFSRHPEVNTVTIRFGILVPALFSLALLPACSDNSPQSAAVNPDMGTPAAGSAAGTALLSGIETANMNSAVKPGDDFYQYVNGTWLANNTIPADKVSWGAFTILRDNAEQDVLDIILSSAEGDFQEGSEEQQVGDLYNSYLDMASRNTKGLTPLQEDLNRIALIETPAQLARYFAYANKFGYGTPFNVDQEVDFNDPNTYMIYSWQGGLGLPDREYYFKDDAATRDIREKYVAHIARMFDLAGIGNGAENAATVMAIETRLAGQHMLKEDTRDMVLLYNPTPVSELSSLMPGFDWNSFLDEAGLTGLDTLVVTQLDYMKALDGIISDTDMAAWKVFMQWGLINATAGQLNTELDDANFDFYSRTMNGQEEQRPMERRGVSLVNGLLGEAVGKVYVDRHFPPEAKARMETLVQNLLKAYEASISELDWMSADTRTQALDKLSKFTPKIGYPDKWKDYSSLHVDAGDLFGNLQRAALFEYQEKLDRIGKPVDRTEWGMTPQTVNAYYNPPLNEIVFPAAILQPPFFNMQADDAVNYGAIGAVIGHEIGHGFDDSGSTFDGDGVLRNWWTDEDHAEFEKRTAQLIGQYNGFQVFDDLNVNGEFTLGENIGDLGGISIGLKAYHMTLEGKEAPVLDGFTGDQRVFIGFGQVWQQLYRDEALRQQVATDPHSPAMFRANGPVRNVPEFYTAFDVQPGDAMYLPPEERVKIW
jgi:putative endopeptidase